MTSPRSATTASFARIEVKARDAGAAERAGAEAFAAGASGLEERGSPDAPRLDIYVPAERAEALRAALVALRDPSLMVGASQPVVQRAWSEAWREALAPVVVSPRLAVVPEGLAFDPAPGQAVVRIRVGQAFGTGGHASTRLALRGLDALGPLAGTRVLDVGCGSGVLALAALALGAESAVACDIDPLATQATRDHAGGARLHVVQGSTAALAARFEAIVANLLRREMLPLLPDLARLLAPGGALVLSGLLGSERVRVETSLAGFGLLPGAMWSEPESSGDSWIGLLVHAR